MTPGKFPKVMRVRLNEKGMEAVAVLKNRSGVVVGHTRDGAACLVRWDGRKRPTAWLHDFLTEDPR